jgi:hypothetical protein
MNTIKIVRLISGEDIVGTLTDTLDGNYDVAEPMAVDVEFRGKESGLIMRHWLPVQIVKKNEISLSRKDVLCILEPSDEFCEYYANTVEKIRELLQARDLIDDMEEDEMDDIMIDFENLQQNGDTLH